MENSSLHQSGPGPEKNKQLAEIKASKSWGSDDQSNRDPDNTVLQDEDGSKDASPNYNRPILKLGVDRSSQSRSSSSVQKEQLQAEIQVVSIKAKMEGIMEENERLKIYIDQILQDYRALQLQYPQVVLEQDANKYPNPSGYTHAQESHDQITLSPGISSKHRNIPNHHDTKPVPTDDNATSETQNEEGLTLSLNCNFSESKNSTNSHENSVDEIKEEEANATWRGKKVKNVREDSEDIDEISQENPKKRARVSVRVRCDSLTMNDGCQWRKYGQKISKGNPCPRAYYRCTMAPSCPVRKQVQRCLEDMSILITTYEGAHNHPLPASATSMASTTSAAASMLLSGSSTSGIGSSSSSSSTTTNLHGLNLFLSNNSTTKPLYLPNSYISSSHSYSHPTITLDLTSSSSLSSSLSNLIRPNSFPTRPSTTNLNFSSMDSGPSQISWTNGMLIYDMNPTLDNSLSFGTQMHETLHQSYLQKTTSNLNHSQPSLPHDTIAAATKAITSDPNFQSAIAAAITSIIGSGSSSDNQIHPGKISNQISCISKENESFPILSPNSSSKAFQLTPSFLNMSSSSMSSQQSGLTFQSPSLPIAKFKSKPNSMSDKNDHV